MNDADLAWAAGIIDGEGYVAITRTKSEYGSGIHWGLRITVSNTDIRMVEKLTRDLGGRIHGPYGKGKRSLWWSWEQTSSRAAATLKLLLPFLVTKHDQAEVALAFFQRITPGGTRYKLSLRESAIRERFHQQLHDLRVVGGDSHS